MKRRIEVVANCRRGKEKIPLWAMQVWVRSGNFSGGLPRVTEFLKLQKASGMIAEHIEIALPLPRESRLERCGCCGWDLGRSASGDAAPFHFLTPQLLQTQQQFDSIVNT